MNRHGMLKKQMVAEEVQLDKKRNLVERVLDRYNHN